MSKGTYTEHDDKVTLALLLAGAALLGLFILALRCAS